MQNRFYTLEHLLRSMLEVQTAMMTTMTQVQQALLSGMMHTPGEVGRKSNQPEAKPEGTTSKAEQATKPEHAATKTEQQIKTPAETKAAQKKLTAAPRRRS